MQDRTIRFVGLILVAFLCGGCTIASAIRLGPQTNFVYPNSNVKALGPVQATYSTFPQILVPPGIRTLTCPGAGPASSHPATGSP